jgi:hypothetical protein
MARNRQRNERGKQIIAPVPLPKVSAPVGSLRTLFSSNWKNLLFRDIKFPGWALFIWGTLIVIPDIKTRLDFWWDASAYLGGELAMVAAVLTSPLFGAFLMIIGVAYIVLVDESKRPTVRHRWWPIFGWAAVGLIFYAAYTVTMISYVTQQVGPRHIFPRQEAAIRGVLSKIVTESKQTVDVDYVASCFDCDGYAKEYIDLLNSLPGWAAINHGTVLGPGADFTSSFGVAIGDTSSNASIALQKAFAEAHISFGLVKPRGHGGSMAANAEMMISARSRR